jgi:hypothetical protein
MRGPLEAPRRARGSAFAAHGSSRRRTTLGALGLVLALSLGSVAGAAEDERIYRWEDARGVPHFSDRAEDVPPAYRHQLGLSDPEVPAHRPPEGAAEAARGGPEEAAVPAWKRFGDGPGRALEDASTSLLVGGALAALVLAGLGMAFGAVVLLVACRLVGQESPGFRKAYGIVIVQFLAGLVVSPGVVVVLGPAQSLSGLLGIQAVNAVATLGVHAAILRAMLCESFGRALGLALVVVLVSFVLGLVLGLGFVTCGVGSALLGAG